MLLWRCFTNKFSSCRVNGVLDSCHILFLLCFYILFYVLVWCKQEINLNGYLERIYRKSANILQGSFLIQSVNQLLLRPPMRTSVFGPSASRLPVAFDLVRWLYPMFIRYLFFTCFYHHFEHFSFGCFLDIYSKLPSTSSDSKIPSLFWKRGRSSVIRPTYFICIDFVSFCCSSFSRCHLPCIVFLNLCSEAYQIYFSISIGKDKSNPDEVS